MRITGGSSRGRLLLSEKGLDIRPTSSKVREAVFNIIGNDLSGMNVLDLFAGTGIMGLEALSRNADFSLFVDNSGRALRLIKKNIETCGFSDSGFTIKKNLKEDLPSHDLLSRGNIDLIFMDPPYGKDLIPGVLEAISLKGIMSPDSICVTESMKEDELPELSGDLRLIKFRVYGETKIAFYGKGKINESKNCGISGNL